MTLIQKLIIGLCAVISFGSCSDNTAEYPKRIDDRLYTTESTFYIMDENDTLSKLLNDKALQIAE